MCSAISAMGSVWIRRERAYGALFCEQSQRSKQPAPTEGSTGARHRVIMSRSGHGHKSRDKGFAQLLSSHLSLQGSLRRPSGQKGPMVRWLRMARLKCIVLIPLARNDGSPVRATELRGILNRFLEEFGGYTVAGPVEGGWRSPSGAT